MVNRLMIALVLTLAAASAMAQQPLAAPEPLGKEITFKGAGELELSGTLVIPDSKTPVPAFLLLPGSGPTDRDGSAGGMKIDILRQIAERLAKAGVATLRFDKRAVIRYQTAWPKEPEALNQFFSYRNFIDDAKAAYKTLKYEPGIDSKRVGLLGHSEGGLFTLQLATDFVGSPDEPFKIILMGTAGRPMGPVIHDQIQLRINGPNVPRELGQNLLNYSDEASFALLHGDPLPPNEPEQMKALYNPVVLDLLSAYLKVDPLELASKYPGPVLILNGSDDTQVSPTKDADVLYKAFKKRSTGTVTFTLVIGGTHNFKSSAGRGRDAFLGPLMPQALEAIAAFAGK